MKRIVASTILLLAPLATLHAADLELSETRQLPECHSIGWVNAWVKANPQARDQQGWDGTLDVWELGRLTIANGFQSMDTCCTETHRRFGKCSPGQVRGAARSLERRMPKRRLSES